MNRVLTQETKVPASTTVNRSNSRDQTDFVKHEKQAAERKGLTVKEYRLKLYQEMARRAG
jgi:hypothetical protein